ncbi:sulfurtransferase [Asticcacaulis sp. 201]|uniref:sulfurtransferase n=1 Tax=Asticcacaulis sp. 201 TaxID=3028787 RepID=UPI0029161C1F|nr:rhodanese-like domain-containing protein [Asticcacaulis sp. 201]MDV6330770.1 rhodanese-like domain-containing protein [Asticcacaulis sp. 201]
MSRQDVLISATDLNAQLDSVVILAVGIVSEGIPGAVAVEPSAFAGAGGGLQGARPLPSIEDLQSNVRSWGINDDTPVVLYDANGNLSAARGWWTLKWAGLANVRLLDGGQAAWEEAELPFAPLQPRNATGSATLSAGHMAQIDADGADAYARHHILVDARNEKAFGGGHISGSRNLPASGNLDENDRFLPDNALRARYAFRDGAHIGVSCGSGVSAAHDIAALAIIDIPAALFIGSWSAWSADATRPVAHASA